MREINWKTENLTIIDNSSIDEILKIDRAKCPYHTDNYYTLLEKPFTFGRLLYRKKDGEPLMYWFLEEEIGNFLIKCYNSILPYDEELDIIISSYKGNCIELGNTLTIYVEETRIEYCNYLKNFNPTVKYQSPYIIFVFFSNFQKDWLERECHVF